MIMAEKETLDCEYSDCKWVSKKAPIEVCLSLLQIHIKANHSGVADSKPSPPAVKPEKAKRPEIAAEMSDEDWAYFFSRWEDYKKVTGLQGEDIVCN